jgi:Ca2+-binding EF-hand superfamily protein
VTRFTLMVALSGLLLLASLSLIPAAAPPRTWTDAPCDDEIQDAIFLADGGPILLRFRVRIDGKPLRAAWNAFLNDVFEYLDANGDGVVDENEIENLPNMNTLFNNNGFPFQGRGRGPAVEKLEGEITRERLGELYRKQGLVPIQFGLSNDGGMVVGAPGRGGRGRGMAGQTADQRLFELLDTNSDGKLSAAELAAAPKLLDRLDRDENEILSQAELLEQNTPTNGAVFYTQVGGMTTDSQVFVLVGAGMSRLDMANKLLTKYASGLPATRKQLGLSEAVFARLDIDHNGKLDVSEVARFANRSADLELSFWISSGDRSVLKVLAPNGRKSPLADAVKTGPGGELLLHTRDTRLCFTEPREDTGMRVNFNNSKAQIENQFRRADRNKDGYLSEDEARSTFFGPVFERIDRNKDGKISLDEINDYVDRMNRLTQSANRSCVVVRVQDQGQGLFNLMDRDSKGELGLRDLRSAVNLLAEYDRNGDGFLETSEIPRSYRLESRLGRPTGFVLRGMGNRSPTRRQPTQGPLWFRKMDRNGDGDVSRKEFLGSDEDFRRLDTDGDGLISLEEALAADRALRKKG